VILPGTGKQILSRMSVIEQLVRHQAQLTQQILSALECHEKATDLPAMQSLADLKYVEEQLEDQSTFRNLVSFLNTLFCKWHKL
jgi:ferritin